MGGGRRADLVLLDDEAKPVCTWYGGELVVEQGRITSGLDEALSSRYEYPKAAFSTVKLPEQVTLVPALPTEPVTANLIRFALPGIELFHERLALEPADDWPTLLARTRPLLRDDRRAPREVRRQRRPWAPEGLRS